jgi:hypothetical protein
MADAYVDPDVAAGDDSGDSWTNAKGTVQEGITVAGAGGTVFFKSSSGTDDTAGATRIITGAGGFNNPVRIIGCLSTASTVPPPDSETASRGDTLPVIACTDAGADITFRSAVYCHGVRFESVDDFYLDNSYATFVGQDCELSWAGDLFNSSTSSYWGLYNCELNSTAVGARIFSQRGRIDIIGGEQTGSIPTGFTHQGYNPILWLGVDLTNKSTGTYCDLTSAWYRTHFINCGLGAAALTTSGTSSLAGSVEFIQCYSGVKGDAGSSVEYHKAEQGGDVDADLGVYRTGGTSDGVQPWSYSMNPGSNVTLDLTRMAVTTPWFGAKVTGDNSTQKTFTVQFAHDGTDTSIFDDEIWMDLFLPSTDKSATHTFHHEHMISPGGQTPSATGGQLITSSETWTDVGTEASTSQALQYTTTTAIGNHTGMAYCRVIYAKRNGQTIYVDPLLVVADA